MVWSRQHRGGITMSRCVRRLGFRARGDRVGQRRSACLRGRHPDGGRGATSGDHDGLRRLSGAGLDPGHLRHRWCRCGAGAAVLPGAGAGHAGPPGAVDGRPGGVGNYATVRSSRRFQTFPNPSVFAGDTVVARGTVGRRDVRRSACRCRSRSPRGPPSRSAGDQALGAGAERTGAVPVVPIRPPIRARAAGSTSCRS